MTVMSWMLDGEGTRNSALCLQHPQVVQWAWVQTNGTAQVLPVVTATGMATATVERREVTAEIEARQECLRHLEEDMMSAEEGRPR